MKRALLVALTAALVAAAPAAAFTPADPLAANQWYLTAGSRVRRLADAAAHARAGEGGDRRLRHRQHASRLRRADRRREELRRRQPATSTPRATAPSSPARSQRSSTRPGIVGMAYASQLLVAKVVKPDGSIPLTAESDAIRWAADSGREGDQPQPRRPPRPAAPEQRLLLAARGERDRATRSRRASSIVAAVGNSDEAPSSPWNYASYPAALPHVIGVSALTQNGDVADFSNRDPIFNDISAPGVGIFSTFPLALTANSAELHRPGLLRLRRARLLQRRGDVVRRAAGLRRRGHALRRRPGADELPGRGHPRAERGRRERGRTAARSARSAATGSAAGDGSTSRARSRRSRDRCRRRTSTRRTTTPARRRGSCGARRSPCPRRSTTTTTRSTSTRSRSGRESS